MKNSHAVFLSSANVQDTEKVSFAPYNKLNSVFYRKYYSRGGLIKKCRKFAAQTVIFYFYLTLMLLFRRIIFTRRRLYHTAE